MKNMRATKGKVFARISLLLAICASMAAVSNAGDEISTFTNWTMSGPSGGDIRAVAIDPKDKNHLLLTTLDGQVYDSIDAGTSFRLLANFNSPQLILDNLIIDSRDSRRLYVSGHRHKRAGGFFMSTDGGLTWKESKQLKNEAIHALTQSPMNPDMLVAGAVNGVFVSKDSGETWEKLPGSTVPVNIDSLAVDPKNANEIYAGTWYRPYKSTDGGNTWKLIKQGMIDDSDVFAVDINPNDSNNVIASACSGIYLSNDKGENWKKVQGIPAQSRRTRALIMNPVNTEFLYAGTTEGFWMSSNSGATWSMTTSKGLEVNSIAVHPSQPSRVFIATNNNGLMVSNDFGRTFSTNNGNFSSRFAYSITPDVEMKNRVYATTRNTATGGGFVFMSDDAGKTWQDISSNLDTKRIMSFSLVQDKVNPQKLYLGTNVGIFQTSNRGKSWTAVTSTAPVKKSRTSRRTKTAGAAPAAAPAGSTATLNSQVNLLVRTEDGKNGFFAGTDKGLFRSYDIAKGWEKIKLPLGGAEMVHAFHVVPSDPSHLWLGTAGGAVLESRDGGATWIRSSAVKEGFPVSSIETNPQDPNVIFVGTVQTVYRSTDGGKTWIRRGGGLPLGNYTSILINPENPSDMFAGSALEASGGLFHSSNGGETWKRIDNQEDVASSRIWSLMFNPANQNELLVGTQSAGIYKLSRTTEAKANPSTPNTTRPQTVRARVLTSN